jgi:hypothetical protein
MVALPGLLMLVCLPQLALPSVKQGLQITYQTVNRHAAKIKRHHKKTEGPKETSDKLCRPRREGIFRVK